MTKSAREVIERAVVRCSTPREGFDAREFFEILDSAGYAIVPKEPTEVPHLYIRYLDVEKPEYESDEPLESRREKLFTYICSLYRAMLQSYSSEGGGE